MRFFIADDHELIRESLAHLLSETWGEETEVLGVPDFTALLQALAAHGGEGLVRCPNGTYVARSGIAPQSLDNSLSCACGMWTPRSSARAPITARVRK